MKLLARVNPVTPFVAAVLFSLPMLATIDVVSSSVALALWLVLFAASGVGPGTIVRRSWPLLVAAPISGLSMLLYAAPSGREFARFGFAVISDGSIELALATVLRVLAIGVPTLVALGQIDVTRLGDGLAQVLRLPPRFVLASLAGIRLFDVLREDWQSIALARRARGLGDSGRIRRTAGASFALLVLALRRGGALATAMEARGFGGPASAARSRTWARPSVLTRYDAQLMSIVLAVVTIALSASVLTGEFRLPWAER